MNSKCKRNLAFINNDFCSLLYGDRFLIGNQDAFQIWKLRDIDKEDPTVGILYSLYDAENTITGGVNFIFEGRGYDETQKFINIVNYEDTVVTNCRGVLSVWSANQGFPFLYLY